LPSLRNGPLPSSFSAKVRASSRLPCASRFCPRPRQPRR
jgi:hypothetical protein